MNFIRACFLLLTLAACAPESVEQYHTGETEEEVVSLLNQREYHKAIWMIESREGENPEGKMGYLLAQAYLGKVGLEPLEFAAKILGEIPSSQKLFFPKCSLNAVNKKDIPTKCLLQRVYIFAPDPDSREMKRARTLLRNAFPTAQETPSWNNALIGMVELVSFTKRAGKIYLYATDPNSSPKITDLPWLRSEAKLGLQEAKFSLQRAEYSGDKISKLLGAKENSQWIMRVEGTIEFSKTIGLSRFIDFLRENLLKPSDEIRYGETIDRLKRFVNEEENSL
jgi:hypothetical protein